MVCVPDPMLTRVVLNVATPATNEGEGRIAEPSEEVIVSASVFAVTVFPPASCAVAVTETVPPVATAVA